MTGEAPPDSQSRLAAIVQSQNDIYEPLAGRIKGYPKGFMSSIDMALSVLPKDRVQSAEDWIALLDGKTVPKARASGAASKKKGETKKRKLPMLATASLLVAATAGAYVMTTGPINSGDPVVNVASPATIAVPESTSALDLEPTAPAITLPEVIAPEPPVTIEEETVAVAVAPSQDEQVIPQVEPAPIAETNEPEPEPIETTADSVASPSDSSPAPLPRPAVIATSSTPDEATRPTDEAPIDFVAGSEWTPEMPFEASEISVKEGTFALVSLVRPDLDPEAQEWLRSGTIIYSVDGILVYDNASIASAIAQSSNLAEQETATVELRVRPTKDGPLETHKLVVPVARSVELKNGFRFATTHVSSGWETRVARIPSGADTTLNVGDVIISEAQTNTVMQNADDMEVAMSKLGDNSAQSAYFTITRKGKLDSATLSLISE